MAETAKKQTTKSVKTNNKATTTKSSYSAVIERMNSIMGQYANLPMDSIFSAFGRAFGGYWANQPNIQNNRIKALNPLPCDFTKDELNTFLTNPQNSEYELQQVAEGLKWTNYSWYKTIKSYADMLTYHSYALPQHTTADEIASDGFKREYRLVDKAIKTLNIRDFGKTAVMQAGAQGKVFYVPRYVIDKSHNKVYTFMMQELPKRYCTIIGKNSLSKWTISFNLMYFMEMGTDFRQFGDLFTPYMKDFNDWVTSDNRKAFKGKYVYATRNNAEKLETDVKAWMQNGRWLYYVSLPIDRVWTFEIDDSTAIVASPFSGLMQTFAQQADYEAAQLSLILNPLIKIFTGEIPYYQSQQAKEDDGYRLSLGGRALFEAFFDQLMNAHNTGGTAFYTAPVTNIKSHDFPESAGANDISRSFLTYGMAKSGLQGLVPVTDRPTEESIKASEKLEPQFAKGIYRTLERMLEYILNDTLNLQYNWKVCVFGDVYSDEQTRADCLKLIDKGSIYAYLKLCALDDISFLDMLSMTDLVTESKLLDKLRVPPTSFTQSAKSQPRSDTNGAPTKTEQEKQEDSTIDKAVEE